MTAQRPALGCLILCLAGPLCAFFLGLLSGALGRIFAKAFSFAWSLLDKL